MYIFDLNRQPLEKRTKVKAIGSASSRFPRQVTFSLKAASKLAGVGLGHTHAICQRFIAWKRRPLVPLVDDQFKDKQGLCGR
jgi:hypothetical protein